ncbi:MAG: beta-eliminating lyase-related protein [Spirochaetia bacterium]|jgi:threonine aldolase|nr:beta-eliminating lyase-related protein [Spirochaetia bacterium]
MNDGQRWFASDNNASTHPRIMEALARANTGHAVGYGGDPDTSRAEQAVAALFGKGSQVRFVLNGTGSNVYAIGCFAGQGDAIICADCAHIVVDETGAPTAVTGAQLVPLKTTDGKLDPVNLAHVLKDFRDDMHKPRPAVVSISQPTELGTVYSLAELDALIRIAHDLGSVVHIDGARLANAAAALGVGPAEAAGDADVIGFGGTKNGLMFGEAVVFMPRIIDALPDTARLRKTRLQLASKMRYIAAQFEEYVRDGLWLENALAANRAGARLYEGVRRLGIPVAYPVDTNGIFARIPAPVAETLRTKRFFYDWEGGLVRWMTSWDSTEADIETFLADLSATLAEYRKSHPEQAPGPEELRQRVALANGRKLMKSNWAEMERFASDQSKGLPMPPFVNLQPGQPGQPGQPAQQVLIKLPDPKAAGLGSKSFASCTAERKSRRKYSQEPLSLDELSFLLWASQGVRGARADRFILRTVPSGGSRHPLDTHIYVRRVTGLEPGLYRFMPVEHAVVLSAPASAALDAAFDSALFEQLWNCAALFVWTAVPYRTEWRYTTSAAKIILLDAGHACQALYGACEALGLGTCAIGAYDQAPLDKALGVDGQDEFAVYAAPVGRG